MAGILLTIGIIIMCALFVIFIAASVPDPPNEIELRYDAYWARRVREKEEK